MTATAEQVAADLTEELASSPLDVDEILHSATATLSRLRPGTWVAAVMSNDPSIVVTIAADESNPRLAGWVQRYMSSLEPRGRRVTATGMVRSVIETGQPALIPSVPMERLFDHMTPGARTWYDQNPSPTELRSVAAIVVPMRAFGQTVGTLSYTAWNPERPLDSRDVAWTQIVADRIGMVVEHAQCHCASIVRLDRLTAIRNVSLALASSEDLRLTLHLVLEQLTSKLHVAAADLLQVDATSNELRPSASVGFNSGWVGDVKVPITTELADAAASGRRFELYSDPAWLGTGRRSVFAREGFTGYRAVPLMARNRLLGVLEVFARTELNVDEEWTGFLHAMAVSAAVAIDNAGLHERVERGSGPVRAMVQRPDLSAMEWRILALVVEGATNREIAGTVHLSENTIKFHIRRLLDRLGAVNRTDLARKATQNSWL